MCVSFGACVHIALMCWWAAAPSAASTNHLCKHSGVRAPDNAPPFDLGPCARGLQYHTMAPGHTNPQLFQAPLSPPRPLSIAPTSPGSARRARGARVLNCAVLIHRSHRVRPSWASPPPQALRDVHEVHGAWAHRLSAEERTRLELAAQVGNCRGACVLAGCSSCVLLDAPGKDRTWQLSSGPMLRHACDWVHCNQHCQYTISVHLFPSLPAPGGRVARLGARGPAAGVHGADAAAGGGNAHSHAAATSGAAGAAGAVRAGEPVLTVFTVWVMVG